MWVWRVERPGNDSCQRPDYGQKSVSETVVYMNHLERASTPKYFTEFGIFNACNDDDPCDILFAMTCWH